MTGRGHGDINIRLAASFTACKTFGEKNDSRREERTDTRVLVSHCFRFYGCRLRDEGQGGKVLILGDPHGRSLGVPI